MRKRNRESMSIALWVLWGAVGCAREGALDAQNVPQEAPPAVRIGVYAFDGTDTDASKNAVIHQVYSRAEVRTKSYFAGPDLAGSTVRETIESGKARVCNDWRAGKIDAVALTGYSRGAMIALAVAHELLQVREPGEPEGCENVNSRIAGFAYGNAVISKSLMTIHSYIGRSDKPVFAKLALLDAVNTLNYDLGKELPAQIRALSPATRCFHFKKKNSDEHVLTTLELQECETEPEASGANHTELAQLPEARDALETSLASNGIVFRDAPNVAQLPPANYATLCSLVKESFPNARDGYDRCVKAGCSWQSAPSEPGPSVAPESSIVSKREALVPPG